MQAFLEGWIHAMKCLISVSLVLLPVFPGLASDVSAGSWTCENAGMTRQVLVYYPEAPARLPCKVFYAKPGDNVLPRALWEAQNTEHYCERRAAEFVEKLTSLGWQCTVDDNDN